MKRLPLLFVIFTSALFNLYADTEKKPTQVEIVAVLRGFDVVSAMGTQSKPTNGDQTVQLPKVTTKSGKTAVIRVIREFPYPIDFDADNAPITFDISNLGVILTIKPYIVNGGANFSGNLFLSAVEESADSKSKGGNIPTIRTTKKIFSGKAKSGEPITVTTLSPSGDEVTLSFTLMLMDQAGMKVE